MEFCYDSMLVEEFHDALIPLDSTEPMGTMKNKHSRPGSASGLPGSEPRFVFFAGVCNGCSASGSSAVSAAADLIYSARGSGTWEVLEVYNFPFLRLLVSFNTDRHISWQVWHPDHRMCMILPGACALMSLCPSRCFPSETIWGANWMPIDFSLSKHRSKMGSSPNDGKWMLVNG